MMTRQKTLWFTLLLIGLYTSFLNASEITRWVITSPDSICWRVNGVHNDHIEMMLQTTMGIIRDSTKSR